LVVNRTGAAGVIGSTFVAKSKPDGYALLLARVGSQAAVPAINRKIPYKWDDFTFLGLLEQNPFALTVSAKSPYKTFKDLEKAAKSGKKLSYSSAGVGALQHLGMVILLDELGLNQDSMKHIPFKGGGKAGAAVIGGHVDIFFQNLSGVIGNIQGGQMRALAVTTAKRAPSISSVPTFRELGYPKMEVVMGWSGLWGPKNLPADVVGKWTGLLQKLKTDKAWNKMTKGLGSLPMIMNPVDTKAFVKIQYETFKEVTERLGLTIK
jgi:tripartite-type tricarboxylate transporter receptor subunit TctC